MANLGDLVAYLKADTKNFDRNLASSASKSRQFATVASKSMMTVRSQVGRTVSALTGLKSQILFLAGAAGIGMLGRSFLNASRESENYRLRLNALLGSTKEGGRMFQEMSKFAGEVPFSYRDIMSSATQLSGVMRGGVEEVKEWMPLIADLAAVSGLGIEKATEQVVRMYSAGAASADMFRERGITAMLGFQSGVSYSAEETRKRLMEAWNDPASKFKDATKNMALSWDGIMSMIGDKWFQFRNLLMDAGVFDAMKAKLSSLNDAIGNWIKDNAQLIKQKVPEYLEKIGRAANFAWEFIKYIVDAVKTLWGLISAIPKGFLDYLDNVAKRSAKAEEELSKLNDTIKDIKAPERTSWQEFWDYLGVYGTSIIEMFKFMGKFFGETLGLMVGDAYEFVAVVGKQFYNLGELMWNAMTFDIKGARESYVKLGAINNDFLKQIAINWQAYEEGIESSWDEMMKRIREKMYGPPPPPPKEYIDSWMRNMSTAVPEAQKPPPPPEPVDWDKHWKKYWDSLQGSIEMSKALASSTENLHEEFRLMASTQAGVQKMAPGYDADAESAVRLAKAIGEATTAEQKHQTALAMHDFQKARYDKMVSAYQSMYSGMKEKDQDYLDFQAMMLKQQYDQYVDATGDEVTAGKWLNEQRAALLDEYLTSTSESYKFLANISQRTAEAIEQSFSDFFFDVLTGKFEGWREYLTGLFQSIQRITADMLGQLVKDWLLGQAKKLLSMDEEAVKAKERIASLTTETGAQTGLTGVLSGQIGVVTGLTAAYNALAMAKAAAGITGGLSGVAGGASLAVVGGGGSTTGLGDFGMGAVDLGTMGMQHGGFIDELIYGIGQKTGKRYSFGEKGTKEVVIPTRRLPEFVDKIKESGVFAERLSGLIGGGSSEPPGMFMGAFSTLMGQQKDKQLPGLQAGGMASANKEYIVGEKGPEVLRMGSKTGRVEPMDEKTPENPVQVTVYNVMDKSILEEAYLSAGFGNAVINHMGKRRSQITRMLK